MHIIKEVNLKRLHTVWFQLYDILEKPKYEDTKKVGVSKGADTGK